MTAGIRQSGRAWRIRKSGQAAFMVLLLTGIRCGGSCSLIDSTPPGESAWSYIPANAVMSLRPVVFFSQQVDSVQVLHNNQPVSITLEPLDSPDLARVTDIVVLVATDALTPGAYCAAGATCAVATPTFDTSTPTVTSATFRALKANSGGCVSMSCSTRRAVTIDLSYDATAAPRVANWFIEVGADDTDYTQAIALLARSTPEVVGDVATEDIFEWSPRDSSFERLKRACVQIRAVLWDGTLTTPQQLGCKAFDE